MNVAFTPLRMVGVWCERGAHGQDAGEACNLYVSSHIPRQPRLTHSPDLWGLQQMLTLLPYLPAISQKPYGHKMYGRVWV